jgi:riboflavin kinase/FMN adenylyltransferase
MQVFYSIDEVKLEGNPVATMGTFDGVHHGHRAVIQHLIEEAKKRNAKSLLITFDPHPRIVLNKGAKDLRLINNPKEKISLISKQGIDYLLVLPFTFEFSKTTAREFILHYLIDKLHVQAMTIGYDHHFGRMDGETENVEVLLRSLGIEVERIPEFDVENKAVSSTKIRNAIQNGEVQIANQLLGYKYSLCGTVIHGNKIGRTIGFPTANLMLDYKLKLLPLDGVYIVEVVFEDKHYKGMLNVGYKPTVKSNEKTIEVHILNFDRLIYGSRLEIHLCKKIRNEVSFEGLESLKNQLIEDRKKVEKYFENAELV